MPTYWHTSEISIKAQAHNTFNVNHAVWLRLSTWFNPNLTPSLPDHVDKTTTTKFFSCGHKSFRSAVTQSPLSWWALYTSYCSTRYLMTRCLIYGKPTNDCSTGPTSVGVIPIACCRDADRVVNQQIVFPASNFKLIILVVGTAHPVATNK